MWFVGIAFVSLSFNFVFLNFWLCCCYCHQNHHHQNLFIHALILFYVQFFYCMSRKNCANSLVGFFFWFFPWSNDVTNICFLKRKNLKKDFTSLISFFNILFFILNSVLNITYIHFFLLKTQYRPKNLKNLRSNNFSPISLKLYVCFLINSIVKVCELPFMWCMYEIKNAQFLTFSVQPLREIVKWLQGIRWSNLKRIFATVK